MEKFLKQELKAKEEALKKELKAKEESLKNELEVLEKCETIFQSDKAILKKLVEIVKKAMAELPEAPKKYLQKELPEYYFKMLAKYHRLRGTGNPNAFHGEVYMWDFGVSAILICASNLYIAQKYVHFQ
jgi:Txe/YoeB family toxin of Txe-Axe toxin-antitoxin module